MNVRVFQLAITTIHTDECENSKLGPPITPGIEWVCYRIEPTTWNIFLTYGVDSTTTLRFRIVNKYCAITGAESRLGAWTKSRWIMERKRRPRERGCLYRNCGEQQCVVKDWPWGLQAEFENRPCVIKHARGCHVCHRPAPAMPPISSQIFDLGRRIIGATVI
jgi:hypothetical protein